MGEIITVCSSVQGNPKKVLSSSSGISLLIKMDKELILFDTGSGGEELVHNLGKLNIDLKEIHKVVISHRHPDHTDGLKLFLAKGKKGVELYFPAALDKIPEGIRALCGRIIVAKETQMVSDGVYTSGVLGMRIKEQSLCIDSEQGIILLVGCAHPGIVRIVREIKKRLGRDIYAVFGGFHLEFHPAFITRFFINQLKKMGVRKVAPVHCTGETAIKLFKRFYRENFVELNLGERYLFS